VKYVQDNALKARKFASLQEQNEHLVRWEATVADTRIHGTTRQHVGKVFREAERPALSPLPPERFAMFQEAPRKVSRDGHIEVAKAYYSAPPEYLGRHVWARWDNPDYSRIQGISRPPGASKLLNKSNLFAPGRPEDDFTVCLAVVVRFPRLDAHCGRAVGVPGFQ
jgi:hypothetical protein